MALEVIIDATGIRAPDFSEVLEELQASFRQIYGDDIYLGNDSQDGQLLGIFASALTDAYAAAVAVYNALSPATAQGLGLSNVVKINGMSRLVPTFSTVDVVLGGQVGTMITNGVVSDGTTRWLLPSPTVIPSEGQVTVTATAATPGAISATPGTITRIETPQFGWQSATNPAAGAVGSPRETDATLRRRQSLSTMLPSRTNLDGILGAVAAIPGVTKVRGYENDTSSTNANGMTSHSIALVVTGGDATAIAQAILNKKTPGCNTLGSVATTLYTSATPTTIRFYRPTYVDIAVSLTLTAQPGYTFAVGALLKQTVFDYVNSLAEGDDIFLGRLYGVSNLEGAAAAATYGVAGITMAVKPGALSTNNITIGFTSRARIALADIALVVS